MDCVDVDSWSRPQPRISTRPEWRTLKRELRERRAKYNKQLKHPHDIWSLIHKEEIAHAISELDLVILRMMEMERGAPWERTGQKGAPVK